MLLQYFLCVQDIVRNNFRSLCFLKCTSPLSLDIVIANFSSNGVLDYEFLKLVHISFGQINYTLECVLPNLVDVCSITTYL